MALEGRCGATGRRPGRRLRFVDGDGDYVIVHRAVNGGWLWTRYAANHEPIATAGEAYEHHAHAVEMAERVNPGLPVTDRGD